MHTDRVGIYSLYQRLNSLLDYITKSMEVDLSSFTDLLKSIKLMVLVTSKNLAAGKQCAFFLLMKLVKL